MESYQNYRENLPSITKMYVNFLIKFWVIFEKLKTPFWLISIKFQTEFWVN